MRSLRSRLLIGTAAATAALFAIACAFIYLGVRTSLLAEFDTALGTQARAIATLTEWHGAQLRMEADSANLPEFQPGKNAEYFQLRDDHGDVKGRSPSLASSDLVAQHPTGGVPEVKLVTLPDGRAGRQLAYSFEPVIDLEDDHPTTRVAVGRAVVTVARDTAKVDQSLARLGRLLLIVCGVATLAAVGLMAAVVGRGLRPLRELASRIGAIRDEDLSGRVVLRDTPDELRPVVDRLNEMLGRVEAAVVRERSFSADVAHELRTPLAGLETTLEVTASRVREPAEYAEVLRRCLQATRATRGMVETLIMLARADARQLKLTFKPLDLSPLLRECWSSYQDRARQRGLQVDWHVQPESIVSSDRDQLSLVLRNLFDNAVTYADEGGNIRIDAERLEEAIHVTISNTGCSLTPAQIGQVFERFWRGDESRTGTGEHCGLGLAMCRKIVELLDGTVEADCTRGLFSVRLNFRAGRTNPPAAARNVPQARDKAFI